MAKTLGYAIERKVNELTKKIWQTETEYRPAVGRNQPTDGDIFFRRIPN